MSSFQTIDMKRLALCEDISPAELSQIYDDPEKMAQALAKYVGRTETGKIKPNKVRTTIWKEELKRLCEEHFHSEQRFCAEGTHDAEGAQVADSADMSLQTMLWTVSQEIGDQKTGTKSRYPAFYLEPPRQKEKYCKIGLFFGLSSEEVDRFIVRNTEKRSLYSKDLSDLAWILLLDENHAHYDHRKYMNLHGAVRDKLEEGYLEYRKNAQTGGAPGKKPLGTFTLRKEAKTAGLMDIEGFIKSHARDLEDAYQKPRIILDSWIQELRDACDRTDYFDYLADCAKSEARDLPLAIKTENLYSAVNFKEFYGGKGIWNYLEGDSRTLKKTYITYALRFGMPYAVMNRFLEAAGYSELSLLEDRDHPENGKAYFLLIKLLTDWGRQHPEQEEWTEWVTQKWKGGGSAKPLPPAAERAALRQLLGEGPFSGSGLVCEISALYQKATYQEETGRGLPFPFV